MNNIYDVIIIGAGISGMVAAHTLLEKDHSLDVIILEATERIGGRTLSLPVKAQYDTCRFDFGAHWVSISQTHLQKYITSLKLHLTPQKSGTAIAAYKNGFKTFKDHPIVGNILTQYEVKWFFSMLEEQSELYQFASLPGNFITEFYDSISMEKYIDDKMYTTTAKNVVKNIISNTTGLKATQISVMFYLLMCNSTLGFSNMYMNTDDGAREFWIKEGADEICKRIARKIGDDFILLNHPVTEIITKTDCIEVTTPFDKFSAIQVICSIPPEEVLNINFYPDLSTIRKKVLNECNAGHLTKFVITYKEVFINKYNHDPFWRFFGHSGEIFSRDDGAGPISMCLDATKDGNPALMGIIKEPSIYEPGPDHTYKDEVIKQLVKYWGKDAECCIDYREVCWWNTLYVGGCPITATGLGTLKWYHTLKEPVGRIHWAGAELATEWYGFMNGAVQSGHRAAINTLYDMRPQIITSEDLIFLDTRRTHKIRLKSFQLTYTHKTIGIVVFSYLFYRFVIKKLY